MNKNSKIIKSKTMFLFLLTITFSCSSEAPKPPMKTSQKSSYYAPKKDKLKALEEIIKKEKQKMKTLSGDEIKFPLPKKVSEKDYIKKLRSKDCAKFVECLSPKDVAYEVGKTEEWAIRNYEVAVWGKTSDEGKFPKVGSMRCGSRALLIEERENDYKVLSPLDNSVGWVSKVQIAKVIFQNPITFKKCES